MRLETFARHIVEIALNPAPAEFTLSPLEGLRVEVRISPCGDTAFVHIGSVWDRCEYRYPAGEGAWKLAGNRSGMIEEYSRIVTRFIERGA